MKKTFNPKWAVALIACAALLWSAFAAKAQVTPVNIYNLTNMPASMPGNTTSNFFTWGTTPTNNVIPISKGKGFGFVYDTIGGAAGATVVSTLNWAGTVDGTNFTVAIPSLACLNTPAGTSTNRPYTNFPPTLVDNLVAITPYSLVNGCLAGTNVSYGNYKASIRN